MTERTNILSFNPARPNQRSNYLITTFASNYDDLARTSVENMLLKADSATSSQAQNKDIKSKNIFKQIIFYFRLSNPIEWLFILCFSIIVTILLMILDRIIRIGCSRRYMIAHSSNSIFNYIFWVLSSILFLVLATSVGYFISPDADGSGIPEMKTVLSGVTIYRYFSFNAFIGKCLGLFAALVGGASVGKVGPYVHLSCLICNQLMKFSSFSKINKSTSMKTTMLSVACAAGITLALGCPLGGVLFSIESTSSIYIVGNIWKAFFSAVICVLIMRIFNKEKVIEVGESQLFKFHYSVNVLNFIIVGIISGAIGAAASTLIAKGVYIRKKTKYSFLNSRFKFAAIVAIITSTLSFFLPPLQRNDRFIMNFAFSAKDNSIKYFTHPGEGWFLFICFIGKFILTVLGLVCTMPAGVFGPVFAIGAIFGRLYGHIIYKIFGVDMEGAFAMAASAGAFSGFSHTISSALMVFEITGQSSYLPPLLLSSLIGNLVGRSMSMGIFDVLLAIKGLPHLPAVKSGKIYSLTAGDIMSKVDYFLKKDKMKIIDALNVLAKMPKKTYIHIPIIDKMKIIRYTIIVKDMFHFVTEEYEQVKEKYTAKGQSNFNEFFRFIKKKIYGSNRAFLEQMKHKFRKLYISIKDKERLRLNKNFQQESCMRILSVFGELAKNDKLFLGKSIDISHPLLHADRSALTVDISFPVVRLQFLFTFLSVSHVFVTENGKLSGIITKEEFIRKTTG